MNIFIEGIPGSGKTTLVREVSRHMPGYTAYYEGDLSPVELAWCSYMTPAQYKAVLERWPHVEAEIKRCTLQEGDHYITSYTRVLAEDRAFYEQMESMEIYNGRVPYERFREIVFKRYAAYWGDGGIFDCSFFQNIIESLILFYQMSEDAIVEFYRELFQQVTAPFLLMYLEVDDVSTTMEHIRHERVDDTGREIWYELVQQYYKTSPYGQSVEAPATLEEYYKKRIVLEQRILKEVLGGHGVIVPAKNYVIETLLENLRLSE